MVLIGLERLVDQVWSILCMAKQVLKELVLVSNLCTARKILEKMTVLRLVSLLAGWNHIGNLGILFDNIRLLG